MPCTRPLVLVAHALNYRQSGYDPVAWIWTNLLIHGLCSVTVFFILSQFLLPPSVALFGALIFALHPLQSEVVNYVSARSESLAALCYLTSLYCYLRTRHPGPRPALWKTISLFLFSAGLMAKATVATLPACLVIYEAYVWNRARLQQLSIGQIARSQLPYWAICISHLILYQLLSGTQLGEERNPLLQMATQTKGLVHYIATIVMPTNLSVHQQFTESSSPFELAPLLATAAIASLLILLLSLKSRVPALLFGFCWFGLVLLPTSVIPLRILVNDHRPYLALFGPLAAVALILPLRIDLRWALACVTVPFALLSFQRDAIWADEISLWSDAARRGPLMAEAHYNLGFAHHRRGNLGEAMAAYERAVDLSPGYVRAQTNLGAIYRDQGRFTVAAEALEKALESDPRSVATLNNLGLTYSSMGRNEAAIEMYERALRIDAGVAEIWLNLGLSQRDVGLREEALQSLSRALLLDPTLKGGSVGRQ